MTRQILKWEYPAGVLQTRRQIAATTKTRKPKGQELDPTALEVFQPTKKGGGYWKELRHYWAEWGQDLP